MHTDGYTFHIGAVTLISTEIASKQTLKPSFDRKKKLVFLSHIIKQMSNSSDIWLEYLVKHPIFELTNSEKQRTQFIKQKQTRQTSNVIDFVLQHHVRVMTKRDNDLIVAVGSQIRVLNLIAFKDAWMRASQEPAMNQNWIHLVPYKVKTL
jgi:hypothetical protein